MKARAVSFRSAEDLALEVVVTLHPDDATKRVRRLDVTEIIRQPVALGPSYLPIIEQMIPQAANADVSGQFPGGPHACTW